MKANAPEKIYLRPLSDGETYNHWYRTDWENNCIEYTRTDAFIEKAAVWFANRYQSNGSYLNAEDMEDFEKYMKGE